MVVPIVKANTSQIPGMLGKQEGTSTVEVLESTLRDISLSNEDICRIRFLLCSSSLGKKLLVLHPLLALLLKDKID